MRYLICSFVVAWVCITTGTGLANQAESEDGYIQISFNVGFVHGLSISDLVRQANPGKKIFHNGISLTSLSGGADRLNGVALSGLWSGYTEEIKGIQISGLLNTVGGRMNGLQLTGIANINSDEAIGIHVAGILNSTSKNANGIQLAGLANVTIGSESKGIFVAGLLNFAAGDIEAVQISGLANVGGKVTGVQIGVINFASELDGIQIGLISYVKSVGFYQDIWGDELRFAHLGLRSGGSQIYNLLSIGVRTNEPTRWATGWGIGRHISLNPFALEIDLSHSAIFNMGLDRSWRRPESNLFRLRGIGVLPIGQRISLFMGGTLNLFVSSREEGKELVPWVISSSRTASGDWIKLWPGFLAGVRF
jgi:hypothetical protein